MAGIDVQQVPYKGTAPAMNDLVAGTVSFGMDAPSVLNPLIKGGRLTALAVAVPRR
jgi:tripartite-type tricarboxylate transporter receptor subunit TctC